jgi:hypothetical protein
MAGSLLATCGVGVITIIGSARETEPRERPNLLQFRYEGWENVALQRLQQHQTGVATQTNLKTTDRDCQGKQFSPNTQHPIDCLLLPSETPTSTVITATTLFRTQLAAGHPSNIRLVSAG